MNWLRNTWDFVIGFFHSKPAAKIFNAIRRAAPYVDAAMAFAGIALQSTSAGRTLTNILATADALGVQAVLRPNATDAELAVALRNVVTAALKAKFPQAAGSDLNRAVEIAVGALKN
jgi:hypothetical protein